MSDHPIQNLMKDTMEKIREMVDVNTIVGDPVITPDGTTIIPISKIVYGFAAGGSDFTTKSAAGKAADLFFSDSVRLCPPRGSSIFCPDIE